MKTAVGAVLFLLAVSLPCATLSFDALRDFPARAEGDLDFAVDIVRFRNPAGRNLVQVSYDLPYAQLEPFGQVEGGFGVTFKVNVKVRSLINESTQEDSWLSHGIVSGGESTEKGSGLDQFEIELGAGTYELSLSITDSVSGKTGGVSGEIDLPNLGADLTLSDLQLATAINVDTLGSNFTRGNIKAIPNPGRMFGNNIPFLYTRFEIYNMTFDSTGPGSYSATYTILDEEGSEVTSLDPSQKKKRGRTDVWTGAVNVLGLKPGKYSLQVEVSDLETGQVSKMAASFEVARLERRRPPMEPWAAPYFERIDFLVGEETMSFMRSLSDEGKEEFLLDFWLRRDPTPGTPLNEFYDAFAARIREADQKFKSGFESGINSDRGRLYIRYGKPDEMEYHPADPNYPAHEDWFYYKEGGIQFIFSDISGIGKYELIYSSTEDEAGDPNWRAYVSEEFIR